MSRILGIEIRRSAAIGSALILLAVGVALLYLFDEEDWSAGWMQLAMTQRLYLALLWPLALAAGAWQGRREHQSNVIELFASTPRPRAHRTVPTLLAMAVTLAGGYLLMGVAGGVSLLGAAAYLPLSVLAVTAVGVLSLVAAAWLGLAVGRLLPWLITAPVLAVAGLGLLLTIPGATRPRGWLALVFSPIYEMNMPDAYATVSGPISAAQAIWLAALAVTGMLLFATAGWRSRVAALLPVVLGATLAIAVMPHRNRMIVDSVDPVAKALVCAKDEPRVCVSRVHEGLLPDVVPQARAALTVLAKLPGAPTRVSEDNTTYLPYVPAPRTADVALVPIRTGHISDLTPEIVVAAFARSYDCEQGPAWADSLAAAYWLLGRKPVSDEPDVAADAVSRWEQLRALPATQATAQIAAVRKAALECNS
ncbi:hypothetical protein GCM10010168_42770 [Actinoplanes ianthinogenes]|uniref:Uncharacterized protein n=1 Tax=Actinoplanes ianthinogenes TaxID=122358 RepID=A0ABM7LVQ0_9ACTN|nr:hypothetical protein [Actinoplanes ianthinogenes]BCJ43413.1 hypothetical protein Aiant_40700 [Actinoplanes ianthinogenes]GGR20279.1 hypothetical protein GCM10010168_42770 [Actinoplanes ianthinogenes]